MPFRRRLCTLVSSLVLLFSLGQSAGRSTRGRTPNIRNTAEALAAIVGRMNGWSPDSTKVSAIDFEDAKVRHVLAYEFGLRVKGKHREFTLSEDISQWSFLLPALPSADKGRETREAGSLDGAEGKVVLAELQQQEEAAGEELSKRVGTPLPAFTLEGPLELWIEGVTQLRLSMPHDVDAGDVKKVVLAPGAAVTVHGAMEVSLARPMQLPLPLAPLENDPAAEGPAAALLSLAAKLRSVGSVWGNGLGQSKLLLSLRIVEPSAIISTQPTPFTLTSAPPERSTAVPALPATATWVSPPSLAPRLRVKRLSASSVELQVRDAASPSVTQGEPAPAPIASASPQSPLPPPSPPRLSVWPFAFANSSVEKLAAFQRALEAALGDAAQRQGSFQVLKARAGVAKLVTVPFQVELQSSRPYSLESVVGRLGASDDSLGVEQQETPAATEVAVPVKRQQWEVMLREGARGELEPINLKLRGSIEPSVMFSIADLSMNGTLRASPVRPPPSAMMLG